MVVLFGAAGEIRSRCYHTATRTAGTKRPTGAFFRFAHALFESLDTKRTPPCWVVFFLAQQERFELSVRFWRTHDFQS